MAEVLLFIHDFKLGTKISDILIREDRSVEFVDDLTRWPGQLQSDTRLCIVDLDDTDFGTVHLISLLRANRPELQIVGYFKYTVKETHDKLKAAGCNLILTRSSLAKNIPTLVKNL